MASSSTALQRVSMENELLAQAIVILNKISIEFNLIKLQFDLIESRQIEEKVAVPQLRF